MSVTLTAQPAKKSIVSSRMEYVVLGPPYERYAGLYVIYKMNYHVRLLIIFSARKTNLGGCFLNTV